MARARARAKMLGTGYLPPAVGKVDDKEADQEHHYVTCRLGTVMFVNPDLDDASCRRDGYKHA
jgi:hypothetical protein